MLTKETAINVALNELGVTKIKSVKEDFDETITLISVLEDDSEVNYRFMPDGTIEIS